MKRWLQLDLAVGGTPAPTADWLIHSTRDGWTAVGTFSFGVKARLADEGPLLPGVSASLARVSLWSGAIGSGRVAILDKVVDTTSADAASSVGFDVLTVALSNHPTDWLQLGAGGMLFVYGIFGSGNAPLVHEGDPAGSGSSRFAQLVPYLNAEARAGEHFRFIGELLYPGGLTIGLRTLLFGSRHFGELRTAGWRARLDVAAIVTSRDLVGGWETAVLPWIGVGVYPR